MKQLKKVCLLTLIPSLAYAAAPDDAMTKLVQAGMLLQAAGFLEGLVAQIPEVGDELVDYVIQPAVLVGGVMANLKTMQDDFKRAVNQLALISDRTLCASLSIRDLAFIKKTEAELDDLDDPDNPGKKLRDRKSPAGALIGPAIIANLKKLRDKCPKAGCENKLDCLKLGVSDIRFFLQTLRTHLFGKAGVIAIMFKIAKQEGVYNETIAKKVEAPLLRVIEVLDQIVAMLGGTTAPQQASSTTQGVTL